MNISNTISKIKPSQELQNRLTLWLNHLLVIYAFLIPIHNKSKASVFFVMLILFLYRMNFIKYLKDALSNKVVQAFIAFYLVWLFGFLYTENLAYAKDSISKAKYLLFPLFFLSFLDKRFAFRVVGAFIFGMLFSEFISYCIRFDILPTSFYIKSYEIYQSDLINPSPFFNRIDHNIGLSIVVSLLLYQLLNKNISNISKIVSILFILSASINMSFIGSRTGYVVYLFLIMLTLMITYKENIKKAISIGLIVIISVSFLAYNNSTKIKERVDISISSINKILTNKNYHSSIGERVGLTTYSLDVIRDNLLLGVGTGDYMDELRLAISQKDSFLKHISQPHNVYIKTLLQFGVFGLMVLFFLFYRLFTYKECDYYNKGIIILITSSIILFMIPGKFYGYFVLPMFVTLISAMIIQLERDIEYKEIDIKTILVYISVVLIFLIIGITK